LEIGLGTMKKKNRDIFEKTEQLFLEIVVGPK
jgi:hypothetical protein